MNTLDDNIAYRIACTLSWATDYYHALAIMGRNHRTETREAAIMLARTKAGLRGATPVEIQRNVEALQGE